MSIKIPPIRELAVDERRWRIDWLGSVQKNENVASEPTIEAIVSPLREGVKNPATEHDVLGNERTTVQIGIGQLPFLRIGTIWRKGLLQKGAAGYCFTLPNISIFPEDVSIIRSVQRDGIGQYVIPPLTYRVGRSGLYANCLAINYQNDPYGVILPVTEAIRFYFAQSTDLAYVAILGAYEHNLEGIINRELSGYIQEQQRCVLRLRRWLADDDGWTIGRVLHDPVAYAGAKRIHDSLLVAAANHGPAYPECDLPFHGQTQWQARGLRIQLPNGSIRHIIFELLRCSAPFPYNELEVTRDNDGRPADNPEDDIPREEKKPAWAGPRRDSNSRELERSLQSTQEPSARIQSIEIPLPGQQFDALSGKTIIRDPKTSCKYKSDQLRPLVAVPMDSLGTGQGTHGVTTTAPPEIVVKRNRPKGLPSSFTTLIETASSLNTIEGVVAILHGLETSLLIPLTLPPDRAQWAYLQSREKTRRRVMAIEIRHHGKHAYFIEFQLRPSEKKTAGLLRTVEGQPIMDRVFKQIYFQLSAAEGKWEQDSYTPIGLICNRMMHTWSSAEGCALTIMQKL